MSLNTLRVYYWSTFALSIIILVLNFGIGLIALAIVILPLSVLHSRNGLRLNIIKDHAKLILCSATNLLIFALIRPDGVHAMNENGLSALLWTCFRINAGYSRDYENHLTIAALVMILIQVLLDMRLRQLVRRNSLTQSDGPNP